MYEQRSGDVIINVKCAPLHFNSSADLIGTTTSENRFSLHRSNDSKDGLNKIKQTKSLVNGEKIETHCVTNCIKKNINFCPIFSRMMPDMSADCFIPSKRRATEIYIGEYNPILQTLVFSNFVSSPAVRFFRPDARDDLNFKQIDFMHFSVTTIWKLINYRSPDKGVLTPIATMRPEKFGGHLFYAPSLTVQQGGDITRITEYFDFHVGEFINHLTGRSILTNRPSGMAWF
ncbi:hypothetical protein FM996_05400 [Methylosinus sporium]|uniref:Uncharacterized protein n=1 Tax=Methylosinus sporium TaxID=428 RepID=A0A549T2Z8_METSR|nr:MULTISPECIES: hypothetical protein [Methylosinus]MBU3889474.1 hypothetical protein [Methylosinus sp. KRF6]TRL36204.1 hypothetical protein FM996_05400 [Methylosinus sporium]